MPYGAPQRDGGMMWRWPALGACAPLCAGVLYQLCARVDLVNFARKERYLLRAEAERQEERNRKGRGEMLQLL